MSRGSRGSFGSIAPAARSCAAACEARARKEQIIRLSSSAGMGQHCEGVSILCRCPFTVVRQLGSSSMRATGEEAASELFWLCTAGPHHYILFLSASGAPHAAAHRCVLDGVSGAVLQRRYGRPAKKMWERREQHDADGPIAEKHLQPGSSINLLRTDSRRLRTTPSLKLSPARSCVMTRWMRRPEERLA